MEKEQRDALKRRWVKEQMDAAIEGYLAILIMGTFGAVISIAANGWVDGLYHSLIQLPAGLSYFTTLTPLSILGVALAYTIALLDLHDSRKKRVCLSNSKKVCYLIALLPTCLTMGIGFGGAAHFALLIPMGVLTILASPQPYLELATAHPVMTAVAVCAIILASTSHCVIGYIRATKEQEFDEMERKANKTTAAEGSKPDTDEINITPPETAPKDSSGPKLDKE